MRKVQVCPYDEEWVFMFIKESKKLKRIFDNEIVEIHHIGSTSVQGLTAKPIIDILPVVKNINVVDQFNNEMKNIGYEPKGENGITGRRYFQKGGDNRTHHIHIYGVGSPEIDRHLAFRDYLRIDPDMKKKYGDLKEKLALEFPYDIESYINGKDHLVREIEEKALEWYKGKRSLNS
ncbi:GrpB family protein [Bacillus sp. FJAT-27251]|uniref:GrpB family protein n=1 Tax=Bacillus sp. FJAT-27251 TaxID=1684142 RepID=UPI0006A78326|nr:GrpB family protein [Bacillus sp. FJAT-27251]